jgi:hypothetical protein
MKRMEGIDAHPLCWPIGWTRTERSRRKNSRYEVSFANARDDLLHSLRLLGATEAVISSNVPTRQDGLPYSDYSEPTDSGIAVYWVQKDKPQVMACDCWRTVRENVRAVGLALEAMRALERSGASQIFERAFIGFAALPASTKRPWRVVLEIDGQVPWKNGGPKDYIDYQYRALAKLRHPDRGGSHEAMAELNAAKTEAYKELGL